MHWQGQTRAPLEGLQPFPRTESGQLPAWVGVGGTPESAVRAAVYGLPLVLAVIGGSPETVAERSLGRCRRCFSRGSS